MAEEGLGEDAVARDTEAEEMVVGQQDADDGGGHSGNGVQNELAIGGGDVVGSCSGKGIVEMDVGIMFSNEPDDAHGGLSTLGIAAVEEVALPAVAHVGEKFARGNECVDAALGVGGRDAISLWLGLGDAEAVVVGGDGDERTASHDFLDAEVATRGALVGTIDGEVIVESQSFSGLMANDVVAKCDGAGEHHGVAVRVGGGIDEVVGHHVVGCVAHRIGDVGFIVVVVGGGGGFFGAARKKAEQCDDKKECERVYMAFHND